MKDKWPVHTLPSFSQYVNKVFDFGARARAVRDARQEPEISAEAVFRAVFHGFLFRLPSFKQLEGDLAEPALQHWMGVERAFGDDVLRYSLSAFDLEPLEQMLVGVNQKLKRNKAFDPGRVGGRIVAALDGLEILSSYHRCCEFCLERQVPHLDPDGQTVYQTHYYHRVVGCQVISSPVKPFLALEWLQPGEGETTAALRLLERLPRLYGSRFFDLLLLDSLYAIQPVLELARETGWDLVITLKQENRDLYQDALGLFRARPPDLSFQETKPGQSTEVDLWEEEGLPFTSVYPEPMRVLRSQERVTKRHYRKGRLEPETTEHEWVWITTLDQKQVPAQQLRPLGHSRWKQENNGWNDLTQNWAFKHGFLHACRHRPQELSPSGTRQPVANRGLPAVTLIGCLAFVLFSAFTLLHSKIYRRYPMTLLEVSRQLYRSLWKHLPPIRAPSPATG